MAELIGYVALGIGLLGYLWTDPRDVLKIGLPAGFLWIVYFLALGLWTAVATSTLSFIRQIATVYFPDKAMRILSLVILTIMALVVFLAATGPVHLIPIVVNAFKTASAWLRDHPILFRLSNAGAETAFLAYGYLTGAQALMLSASIVIAVNLGTGLRIVLSTRRKAKTT